MFYRQHDQGSFSGQRDRRNPFCDRFRNCDIEVAGRVSPTHCRLREAECEVSRIATRYLGEPGLAAKTLFYEKPDWIFFSTNLRVSRTFGIFFFYERTKL